VWTVDNLTGVNLLLPWLSLTAAAVLWQDVWPAADDVRFVFVSAAMIGGFLLLKLANAARIEILSVRVRDVQMASEPVHTTVSVRPEVGLTAHVLSVVAALSVYGLADTLAISELRLGNAAVPMELISSLAVYVATLCLFMLQATARQFSVSAWQRRLNANRQLIRGHEDEAGLARYMGRLRRRLAAREIAVYLLLGGLALGGLWGLHTPYGVELGFIALICAATIAEAGSAFVQQAWAALAGGRAGIAVERLVIREEESPTPAGGGGLARLVRLLTRSLTRTISLFAGVVGIARFLIEHWATIREWLLVRWIAGLLQAVTGFIGG
jgi:hypothetical protein